MNRPFVSKGGIAFGYKDEKTGTKIGVFLKIFLNGRGKRIGFAARGARLFLKRRSRILFLQNLCRWKWSGILDAIGTVHYLEVSQMRPVLESLHKDLLAA